MLILVNRKFRCDPLCISPIEFLAVPFCPPGLLMFDIPSIFKIVDNGWLARLAFCGLFSNHSFDSQTFPCRLLWASFCGTGTEKLCHNGGAPLWRGFFGIGWAFFGIGFSVFVVELLLKLENLDWNMLKMSSLCCGVTCCSGMASSLLSASEAWLESSSSDRLLDSSFFFLVLALALAFALGLDFLVFALGLAFALAFPLGLALAFGLARTLSNAAASAGSTGWESSSPLLGDPSNDLVFLLFLGVRINLFFLAK